jgi:hypothetical protein
MFDRIIMRKKYHIFAQAVINRWRQFSIELKFFYGFKDGALS